LLALLVGLSPVLAAKLSVRTLIALGLAVAVGAAGLLFVDVLQETFLTIAVKFETLGSPLEEANALWRYLYWVSVLKLWAGSPVFGVGFAHDIGQQDPWLVDTMRGDPHNSYLAMLARTGALGFALFGAFIFMVLLLARRSIRQAQSAGLRSVARSVVGCFLAIGVFASMNVTLEGPYHGPFFWMFAGFTVWIGEQCSVEVRQ
jgi:O-antigen ligase